MGAICQIQRSFAGPRAIHDLSSKIAWDDTVPLPTDRSDIRGRGRLDGALDEILGQHDYPAVIDPRG